MASDDALLVSRVLSGSAEAFENLVDAYRPLIYAVATRHMRLEPDEADEVYQRFLVRLWVDDFRRLRLWRGSRPLGSYLGKIARNVARDYLREKARKHSVEDPETVPAGRETADRERIEQLDRALLSLPERDRELIERRYYRHETYREIGEAVGMTPNHVGVALSRARVRLKRTILEIQGHRKKARPDL